MAQQHRLKLAILPSVVAWVLLHTVAFASEAPEIHIVAFASDPPKMVWLHRPGVNCFPNNGAKILPGWEDIEAESRSFEACRSTCEALDDCKGIVVPAGAVAGSCGLRMDIKLAKCKRDNRYELWERVMDPRTDPLLV